MPQTQTQNDWVKKAEVDSGKRAGIPTDMAERMKALQRENCEAFLPAVALVVTVIFLL